VTALVGICRAGFAGRLTKPKNQKKEKLKKKKPKKGLKLLFFFLSLIT